MKRALLWIGLVTLGAFAAGIFTARFGSNVQQIKEERQKPAPREVPEAWREVRLSPGHAQHIINEPVECNECHDPTIKTFDSPDTGVCTQCHEEQASLAHVDLDGMPMDCYTCHVFGSEPDVFGR
ncbi:MAG: hypothetical protein JRF42_14035, partial [Deltaproteobacteria bacterium]|nr:hypothetical protein [Deltaproteobacteria bacterium]